MISRFPPVSGIVLALFLGLAASRAADITPPTVLSASPPKGGTVGSLTQVTVTFSEPVTNVASSDLLVGGNPTIAVSGSNDVYTFTLEQQPGYGIVQISWDPGHGIQDLADPPNRFNEADPGANWQYNLIDSTPPTIVTLNPAAGATVRSLSQIEVRFSEDVTDVQAADLLINDSPATALTALSQSRYLFQFLPPTNGTVQVRWAVGHNIRDLSPAANPFADSPWTYTLDPSYALPNLRINEFLASNISGLTDEDGQQNDWIEIQNRGTNTVNLAGYSLTDDKDDPAKWTFPATNIAPGQFLVVFASGKNRRSPAPGLRFHTNFKLNPAGNYLALFNTESPRVALSAFDPEFPEQRNNYSYGYSGAGDLVYFPTPTPGATNSATGVTGIVPPPHFNVERGFYDTPITLILNTTLSGATIRYTTNATEPTVTNGLVYTGPLIVSNTTVIRAAAFASNLIPSLTITHTYIYLDQVIRQPNNPPNVPIGSTVMAGYPSDYEMDPEITTNALFGPLMKDALKSLPVISIVCSSNDMFGLAASGAGAGIYTHPTSRGVAWERPCSFEFFLPDGSDGFQINAGVQIQGNAARDPQKQPKHPMRVVFKGDYGPTRLKYQMFPDSPVTDFDTLILRADFNFSWLHWDPNQRARGQRTRDSWLKDSMRAMGNLATHNRYTHLYINGLYWGIYDPSERPDASFAASYLGGEKEQYDVVNEPIVNGNTAVDGDLVAYNQMLAIPNLADNTNYESMKAILDLPVFVDYMLLHFYIGHEDWGNDKNFYCLRKREAGAKFKYLPWDGENILSANTTYNRVSNTDVPSGLHTKLVLNSEYRLDFADRVYKHFFNNGALTPGAVTARWMNRANQVDLPIICESARWGDYRRDVHQYQNPPYELFTRTNQWLVEQNRLVTQYFPNRTATVLSQLQAAGLYPSVAAPSFSKQGGNITRGFNLYMTNNAGGGVLYYTTNGVDPRVQYTGAVSGGAQSYSGPITLSNSVVVKARILNNGTWSALNEATFTVNSLTIPLRITEIMYNPQGGDAYEFIELQNIGVVALDIGYYSLDGVNYVFPANTTLAPGAVILLASSGSPINWTNRYGNIAVFGRFDGNLSNGGEKLAIKDPAGNVVFSVDYDDTGGWPAAADGLGYSLELVDLLGDPDDPANWRASSVINGTPGIVSPPPGGGAVVINEIMADNISAVQNGSTFPDWVELFNSGTQAVSLVDWSLTDDSSPRKFVFPPGTSIPAGGFLVVWCDSDTNAPGLHTLFALGRTGETVSLFDQNTNRIDAATFGVQIPNYTVGRIGGAWTLTSPTTNAANQAVTIGSSTNLVINEWLVHAPAGQDDWVELYNRSATTPVSLQGLYMGVSNITFQLSALSFIGPGGFVQLFADEKAGADHLDFKLPAPGGFIVLYNEIGVEQDRITYGPQQEGISQGRLPNGASTIATFTFSSSPGASNYVLSYTGPILNEVLAVNRQAVTNANGRVVDWVEIYNPSGISASLAGMRLSTDPDDSAQWTFPPGVVIQGNGYVVVWFDEDRPASLIAEPVLNTGHSIHGDGASITLFDTSGRPVDTIEFGFQVPDQSIGRSGGVWTLLSNITLGATNASAAALASANNLRINEWMASPGSSSEDWVELYNLASQPVLLTGCYVSDSAATWALTESPIGPLSFIGANGFVKITADGDPSQGSDHANFTLDADGEVLRLYNPAVGIIDTVFFGLQTPGVSQGRFLDGQGAIVSFPGSATPSESNYRVIQDIVINEVLSHTDPPFEDAIEIFNAGASTVDVSGWYLSDSQRQPRKFRIPNGSLMSPGTFLVFYEYQFGAGNPSSAFTLDSAHGDDIWLSAVDEQDHLTGFRTSVSFGAALNGVSFGRFPTSEGVDFPPLLSKTFGVNNPVDLAAFRAGTGTNNTGPRVGPIVINEIMYHPPDINGNDNTGEEFIELHNITDSNVSLFDPAHTTNHWRLQGGVSFTFPADITISNRGFVLVVNFNPISTIQLAAFRTKYSVPESIRVFGPYSGKLNNDSDSVELQMPDNPQPPGSSDPGFVPYVQVDRVNYRDLPPWPTAADGGVSGVPISIQKSDPSSYGNEGLNWIAGTPTAGRTNGPSFVALPSIVQQPSSFSVAIGSNVIFSVGATGTQPLTYQWRRNGIALSYATNSTLALSGVQSSDEGAYTVLVSNPGGSVLSAAAQLTIGAPPNITQQPRNQVATPGGSATFTVGATGGNLVYQWLFYGTNLPGAAASTLTLSNVDSSAIGPYAVVVTNSFGVLTSAVAYVVMNAPGITAHPQSQRVRTGDSVSFNVGVNGDAPLSYQWRKNSAPIANGTNATFQIASAQLSDGGAYDVIVSNPVGSSTSLVANLTFHVTIAQQPQTLNVRPPTNVTFTVSAVGTGTLLYQWRFNETNIIDGATTTNLTINNVQLTNNGNYSVVVTDDFGSVTSSNAALNVLVNPIILQQPTPQLAMPGQSATFTVTVTNATLPIGYQWLRAPSTVYTNFLLNATNCSFTIANVLLTDAGNFRVTCTNLAGTNNSVFASLTVGPAITVQPTNRAVNVGSNTTFSVIANGSATLRYQWRLFGTNLPTITNSTYTITGVQFSHAGDYTVVVTNNAGAVTSQVAVLTVRQVPAIVAEPQDQTVLEGDTASFTAGATGGDLRYQWRFNDSPLSNGTNSMLTISNALQSNAGGYSLLVTNVLGATTSRVATLTVLFKPSLSAPEMLPGGEFQMFLTAPTNRNYDIEFTINCIDWSFLRTINYSTGGMTIIDNDATNSLNRSYRVLLRY